jgi:biopolymer transport protein ExbD
VRIELGEDEAPEIGLIALIDCIFFLLMFFMVATTFKMQEGQARAKQQAIQLPSAQVSLEEAPQAGPFVVTVDVGGGFSLDGQPVSATTLRERLREVAAAGKDRVIRIDGDRRTSFQHIVQVLDLCQFEGLRNVAVRTKS